MVSLNISLLSVISNRLFRQNRLGEITGEIITSCRQGKQLRDIKNTRPIRAADLELARKFVQLEAQDIAAYKGYRPKRFGGVHVSGESTILTEESIMGLVAELVKSARGQSKQIDRDCAIAALRLFTTGGYLPFSLDQIGVALNEQHGSTESDALLVQALPAVRVILESEGIPFTVSEQNVVLIAKLEDAKRASLALAYGKLLFNRTGGGYQGRFGTGYFGNLPVLNDYCSIGAFSVEPRWKMADEGRDAWRPLKQIIRTKFDVSLIWSGSGLFSLDQAEMMQKSNVPGALLLDILDSDDTL